MQALRLVGERGATRPSPRLAVAALALGLAVLAGCASGPKRISTDRDGPEANPPPGLARVPDAEPKLEPIRPGGPNKPYDALGQRYVPITQDTPFAERGLASWYGRKFHGQRTSSGEPYDMYAMTAAHPTLPIPSYARVRNPANGREVIVRINDRGPFHSGRIVDLSYTAALKLDVLRGVAPVELERITFDDVRTGAWRRRAGDTRLAAIPPVPARAAEAIPSSASATVTPPMPGLPQPVALDAGPVGTAAAVEPELSPAGVTRATGPPPPAGFYVQLGAFRERDGAEVFQRRVLADLDWLAPVLGVFAENPYYRLQAGPYPSRADASRAADRLRADLQLVPLIVERR